MAIFDDRRRVLLVHHNYGRHNWELPGGRGEPAESALETAVREIREELGLEVDPLRATCSPERRRHFPALERPARSACARGGSRSGRSGS